MMRLAWALCALATFHADGAAAQAVGTEVFASSDSDGTEVLRVAIDFDLANESRESYIGARVEEARYNPNGDGWRQRRRAFVRAADSLGQWKLQARIGTDGDRVIGGISAHDDAAFRKELFVERDLVETARGLDQEIYTTFAGAAVDVPVGDRDSITALAGLQTFTGRNERIHLRGNYVHVVKRDWGLSAQVRGRWFRSSVPREADYYSPRSYFEVVPVLQMRRFVEGWELVGAGGLGLQRDSGSKWRQSRLFNARVQSPDTGSRWLVNASVSYTNTPSIAAAGDPGYSYVQGTLTVMRRF
jgi:hypothetical protein